MFPVCLGNSSNGSITAPAASAPTGWLPNVMPFFSLIN
jgi:hypothetical protein